MSEDQIRKINTMHALESSAFRFILIKIDCIYSIDLDGKHLVIVSSYLPTGEIVIVRQVSHVRCACNGTI